MSLCSYDNNYRVKARDEEPHMNAVCFYHSADLDGHCSGAIVKDLHSDARMIGVNYGDPVPWDLITPNTRVYVVDFSFPMDDMARINREALAFYWIDHHKSAIADAEHAQLRLSGRQEIGKAGCELTWEFLHIDETMPRAVRLLGRYDVWDHAYSEDVLPFQMGMRMHDTRPENLDLWSPLLHPDTSEDDIKPILSEGKIILRYQAQENEKYATACAFETMLLGELRCIAINRRLTNSTIFDTVYNPERHDAMLLFGWMAGKWTCSLFSNKPEVDVSVVAKLFGGGGHAGAAGFSCDTLPFQLR